MRRRLRDAGTALALVLLTGALLLFALLYLREAALRSGEELTDSLSRVISEQTARTLQSVDQTLQLGIVRLEALRAAGRLDEASARATLSLGLPEMPFVRALWVVDHEGRVTFHSSGTIIGASMADRPYFQVFLQEPKREFFIGPLLRSRVTGTWMMTVARPMRNADGSLRAVLVGAVEPPYFEQL